MNKYLIALLAVVGVTTVNAQDQYSAAEFATGDLNGTARYVGLGGALDALGGDISVMGSNPAGTAVFKKTDAAVTGSILFTNEDGQLGHDATRGSFDQAGVVFTMPQYNNSTKGLKYINFGVNYQKKKNFFGNADLNIEGLNGTLSQTNQVAALSNESAAYDSWGMLTGLYDQAEVTSYDESTGIRSGVGAKSANYRRYTNGGTTTGDFNVSFNLSNQIFLGFSLGVYDINYNRDAAYTETGVDGVTYDVRNWYETDGDGVDLKFGAIWRPVESSPFRVGLTVHTPTWYRLEDYNGTSIRCGNNELWDQADAYEYNYRTPWKFGLSLGHTIGNYLALGAQYEISDLSTCHYGSVDWNNDNYFSLMNDKIEDQLKTQHTLRLGMEIKPTNNFAVRLGYNYVSSPIKEDAWKESFSDGYNCETDFTNWKGTNRITCGLGYRFKGGYFDVAYQYQMQKGDFYAFDDMTGNDLKPTEIKNDRSQLMATLGFRF